MLRLAIATLATAALAVAEGFTFTIGNPVASQDFHFKAAVFVFRTEGCPGSMKPQLSATAEGIVNGERRSVTLKVMPASKPGVYGIYQSWPAQGHWVVGLKGTCGNSSAGAVVPVGPKGFIRESSKFFSRPATESEIESSLRELGQAGKQ